MKTSITQSKIISLVSGTLFIFIIWILISTIQNDNLIFPRLENIFLSLFNLLTEGDFFINTLLSIGRVLIVIVVSLLISIVFGFIYIWKANIFTFFKPLLFLMKATPLAIISVYLWISLGSDAAPFLITFLMVFPVSIEGFITAINQIDQKYSYQIRLEETTLFKKYIRLYLPMIFPYIIMTLLQTLGMGIKVMLMGEYVCQTSYSLGQMIYFYKSNLDLSSLLAMLIIIVIITIVLELITKKFSSKWIINNL